ncbi:hypothetical protein HD554DRAFT_2176725 [Boletus coccyginus]|nr:hypothetical protein HD554DRAFT_2176725 [Boletus coccyginus]
MSETPQLQPHRTSPEPAVSHHRHHRQFPAKRFWEAFAVALVKYIAPLSLIRIVIHMASSGDMYWDDSGSVGVLTAEDGRIDESIGSPNWGSYQTRPRWVPSFSESTETSFFLPIASI